MHTADNKLTTLVVVLCVLQRKMEPCVECVALDLLWVANPVVLNKVTRRHNAPIEKEQSSRIFRAI